MHCSLYDATGESGGTLYIELGRAKSGDLIAKVYNSVSTTTYTLLTYDNTTIGAWYWLQIAIDSSSITYSYSTDGVNWNDTTISDSTVFGILSNIKSARISNGTYNRFTLDGGVTSVMVDGQIVWQPYKPTTE